MAPQFVGKSLFCQNARGGDVSSIRMNQLLWFQCLAFVNLAASLCNRYYHCHGSVGGCGGLRPKLLHPSRESDHPQIPTWGNKMAPLSLSFSRLKTPYPIFVQQPTWGLSFQPPPFWLPLWCFPSDHAGPVRHLYLLC